MTPDAYLQRMVDDMNRLTTGLLFFYGFILVLALLGFAFWIWMMIDCIKRKRETPLIGWMVLLVFLNVAGAIVYFFAGRTAGASSDVRPGAYRHPETIAKVESVPGGLKVVFDDGQTKTFHWMDFPKLLDAHKDKRQEWQMSADRRALVWPALQFRIGLEQLQNLR